MNLQWVENDPARMPTVRELFREYQRELGIDLCFQSFDEELYSLPGKYAPPLGALLLASEGVQVAGCGALRDLGESTAEIKRLFVRPAFRRRGLARALSESLIERARELRYARIRLDTLRRLAGASELYRSLGFREIEPYNFNPEPDIVYMELRLE